jgi:hypothetical protein
VPLKPEIELPTDKLTVPESIAKVLEYLSSLDADSLISI